MKVLRTPEDRFAGLPDYPFTARILLGNGGLPVGTGAPPPCEACGRQAGEGK